MKLFKRSSKASAENANLIVLSDGTYKEKGGKGSRTKKSKKSSSKTPQTKKKGGLFSRKKKSKKSKQQPSSKVLDAVTIQYPGIPNAEGGGVELDLSFDTAATANTSNELDQFLAELEAATSEKAEPKPEAKEEEHKSSSMLGRAFPRLFDEEGYMRCGCGPSSAPEDVNDDDLTVTSGNKSSDKEKKTEEVNTAVSTSTAADNNGDHSKDIATTNNGDHSKAKDIPEKANATPSTASDVTTETSKVNIEYVCNPSEKADPKVTASKKQKDKNTKKGKAKDKASAVSKAAAAKGAVAASRSAKPPRPPTTSTTRSKTPASSLAKTPSRIVAEGEYSGPVSLDAFYKEEDPDDDASKKEVEQISLMENYKSENESLKAEIQRLKHLKTLEEENESLKAEVLKLQMGMSVVSQMAQDMKEGGKGGQKDPAEIQKEWEEGSVTGMFVRLANMFDDDGFIKCMTPSE